MPLVGGFLDDLTRGIGDGLLVIEITPIGCSHQSNLDGYVALQVGGICSWIFG